MGCYYTARTGAGTVGYGSGRDGVGVVRRKKPLGCGPDLKNRLEMKFAGLTLVCLLPTMFAVAACDGGDATAVRNEGKFVHVDYPPGNTLSVGPQTFQLKSAHLHSPSEHLIDGVSFAAELHLVHGHADGRLVVVALLFRLGEPSPVVQGR